MPTVKLERLDDVTATLRELKGGKYADALELMLALTGLRDLIGRTAPKEVCDVFDSALSHTFVRVSDLAGIDINRTPEIVRDLATMLNAKDLDAVGLINSLGSEG